MWTEIYPRLFYALLIYYIVDNRKEKIMASVKVDKSLLVDKLTKLNERDVNKFNKEYEKWVQTKTKIEADNAKKKAEFDKELKAVFTKLSKDVSEITYVANISDRSYNPLTHKYVDGKGVNIILPRTSTIKFPEVIYTNLPSEPKDPQTDAHSNWTVRQDYLSTLELTKALEVSVNTDWHSRYLR